MKSCFYISDLNIIGNDNDCNERIGKLTKMKLLQHYYQDIVRKRLEETCGDYLLLNTVHDLDNWRRTNIFECQAVADNERGYTIEVDGYSNTQRKRCFIRVSYLVNFINENLLL